MIDSGRAKQCTLVDFLTSRNPATESVRAENQKCPSETDRFGALLDKTNLTRLVGSYRVNQGHARRWGINEVKGVGRATREAWETFVLPGQLDLCPITRRASTN